MQPGYIYAATLEYTLLETYYGGATHSAPLQSGRRLSDAAVVESILRTAMSSLAFADLFVHEVQTSSTTSEWTITITLPEHDLNKWATVINSPVFLPAINSDWAGNANSLFSMVSNSQHERGRHPILGAPPPPRHRR